MRVHVSRTRSPSTFVSSCHCSLFDPQQTPMSSDNSPFAWLGLLKWSLSYSDGTQNVETSPMSPEDKAFLEAVMKEGIIDEGERMKTILKEVTETMEKWKQNPATEEESDTIEDLLQELRDIVEQIDYARAFAAMKGLVFLLGCAQERDTMPRSTRLMCLGIVATMCQNNPPVQKELLEMGAIKTLSELYFAEESGDSSGNMRAKIIQAISALVRGHELAEQVFGQLEQSTDLVNAGLGVGSTTLPPLVLRKRTMFFLSAFLTSDASDRSRVQRFTPALVWVMVNFTDAETEEDVELRELSLAMLEKILSQQTSVNAILEYKRTLVDRGVRRVAALRQLEGEDREFAQIELDHWESIISLLARTTPDSDPAPPMITSGSPDDQNQLLAQ